MSIRQHAMALHESAHAVVGLALGLPVEWVAIVPGIDPEEGWYPAACKITDEAEQDERLALAAMAAPSFVPTHDREVDTYAHMEAGLAYDRAESAGLDVDQIRLDAEREATHRLADIEALAMRLVAEGRVEFAA